MKSYQNIFSAAAVLTSLLVSSIGNASDVPPDLSGSWMVLPPTCGMKEGSFLDSNPYGSPYGSPYGASAYGSPYGASAYGSPYGSPYGSNPYGNPYGSPYGSGTLDFEESEPLLLSELSFLFNFEKSGISFVESDRDLLTGVICKHSEPLVCSFADGEFSIHPKYEVSADLENDGSCPALSVRSLVELYQFVGTYKYLRQGDVLKATSMDDLYCAKHGMPGMRLQLTLFQIK